jgi:mono/diheme cytochrome c family protein
VKLVRGRALVAVVATLAVALLAVPVSLAGSGAAAPATVNVTARDFSFALSPKTAPAGKVTFVVRNTGKSDHSFQIAGRKTAVIKPGRTARLVVTFAKAGPFPYTSAVSGDAAKGMKGTFTVKAAAPAGDGAAIAAGKELFSAQGCGACHVLKAAGTAGTVGPSLDRSTIPLATVILRITAGKGVMQPYAGTLTSKEIQDVAQFVFSSRAG